MIGAVRVQTTAAPPPPSGPPPQAAEAASAGTTAGGGGAAQEMVLRFEDLTIDDELPPLERVTRYVSSSIALQRLVHVKMLSETSVAIGEEMTITHILPLLPPLVVDNESIIRQHVALQLLPLAFACMGYNPTPQLLMDEKQQHQQHRYHHSNTNKYRYCYKAVTDIILPHLANLISDTDGDVRQASAVSISGLVLHQIIRPEDIPSLILRIPLQLLHAGSTNSATSTATSSSSTTAAAAAAKQQQQDKYADMRMTGAALLGDLSPSLPQQLITKFVTPHLLILAKDPAMKVRRVVAGHSISKATINASSEDITLFLFPAFSRLANDDQKYVRRACSEAIVDVSKSIPSDLRNVDLIQLWKKLERDPVKAVKYGALQKLGHFIATFHPNIQQQEEYTNKATTNTTTTGTTTKTNLEAVNELLPYFTGMAFTETNEAQEDASNRLHCAFSFPAVVYTVGVAGWGKLRDAFLHLSRGPEAEILGGKPNQNNASLKRCLACSLHEIAKVAGPQITEMELVPMFEKFLKDPTEQVRFCALRNFHPFVEAGVADPTKRDALLSQVNEMLSTASPMNWRTRDCVASQLIPLMELFDSHSIRNKLTPLVFKLLDDPVAEVREKTCSSIPFLFRKMSWINICQKELGPSNYFATEQDARRWSAMANQEILRVLKALPFMDDFTHRQTYCYICLCCAVPSSSPQPTTSSSEVSVTSSLSDGGDSYKEIMDQHLKYILVKELMPLALGLKDDKVSNVRYLLRKCLHLLPKDIHELSDVSKALKALDMEEELWEDVSKVNKKSKHHPRTSSNTLVPTIVTETTAVTASTDNNSNQEAVAVDTAIVIPQVVNITRVRKSSTSTSTAAELTRITEESSPEDDTIVSPSTNVVAEPTGVIVSIDEELTVVDNNSNDEEILQDNTKTNALKNDEKYDDDDKSVTSIRSVSSWLSSSSRKSTSSQGSKGKLKKLFQKKKSEKGEQVIDKTLSAVVVTAEKNVPSTQAQDGEVAPQSSTSVEKYSTTADVEEKKEHVIAPMDDKNLATTTAAAAAVPVVADGVGETKTIEKQDNESASTESCSKYMDNDDWSLSATSIASSSVWSTPTVKNEAVIAPDPKKVPSENEEDDNNSVASSSSRQSISSWLSTSSLGKAIGLNVKVKSSSLREEKKRGKRDKRKKKTPDSNTTTPTKEEASSGDTNLDAENNDSGSLVSNHSASSSHPKVSSLKNFSGHRNSSMPELQEVPSSASTEEESQMDEKNDENRDGTLVSVRSMAGVLPYSPQWPTMKDTRNKNVQSDGTTTSSALQQQQQQEPSPIRPLEEIRGESSTKFNNEDGDNNNIRHDSFSTQHTISSRILALHAVLVERKPLSELEEEDVISLASI